MESNELDLILSQFGGVNQRIDALTKVVEPVAQKVERHDSELHTIKWISGFSLTGLFGGFIAWLAK